MPSEFLIYDDIGVWGITAKEVVGFLAENTGDIVVRINSPGGDVFDGMAIYNAFKQHDGNVKMVIDGLAASAASFIAMAGDSIEMHEGSFMMIHRAWGMGIGNAEDLNELSSMLQKIDDSIVKTYAKKTGLGTAKITEYMANETWFSSDEADEEGFVDEIIEMKASKTIMNAECLERFNFKNVPTAMFGNQTSSTDSTKEPEAVINLRRMARNRKLDLRKKLAKTQ